MVRKFNMKEDNKDEKNPIISKSFNDVQKKQEKIRGGSDTDASDVYKDAKKDKETIPTDEESKIEEEILVLADDETGSIEKNSKPLTLEIDEENDIHKKIEKETEKITNIEGLKIDREEILDLIDDETGNNEGIDNLSSLQEKVKETRLAFAKMDLKKGQLWKRVLKYFPKLKESYKEDDKDVLAERDKYEKALKNYQEARLNEAKKDATVGDEKLAKIFEYFDKNEKSALYDARTDARAEQLGGTKQEWVKNKINEAINWYIKLPLKTKILVSGGLFLGAAGSAALGASGVAAVFMAANLGKRILTISASFVGMETIAEKGAEKYREKKSEKKIVNLKEKLNAEKDLEKKFKILKDALDKNNKKVSADLQKRKLGSLLRKTGAATFACFSPQIFSFIGEKTGLADALKEAGKFVGEKTGLAEILKEKAEFMQGNGAGNEGPKLPRVDEAAIVEPEGVAEIPGGENLNLGIEKGGSLEGRIIEHLKNEGMDPKEAGRKVHLMAEEFIKEHDLKKGAYDLVQPGTQIELSPEGDKIISIESGDLKSLGGAADELNGSGKVEPASIPETSTVAEPSMNAEAEKEIPKNIQDEAHNEENIKVNEESLGDYPEKDEADSMMAEKDISDQKVPDNFDSVTQKPEIEREALENNPKVDAEQAMDKENSVTEKDIPNEATILKEHMVNAEAYNGAEKLGRIAEEYNERAIFNKKYNLHILSESEILNLESKSGYMKEIADMLKNEEIKYSARNYSEPIIKTIFGDSEKSLELWNSMQKMTLAEIEKNYPAIVKNTYELEGKFVEAFPDSKKIPYKKGQTLLQWINEVARELRDIRK